MIRDQLCDLPNTEDRRSKILEKSADIFSRRGFPQVGVRELAAHLSLSPGSIYYHIESKEALLHELIEDLYSELLAHAVKIEKVERGSQLLLFKLIDAHVKMHSKLASYFKVTTMDFRYLNLESIANINVLKGRYESIYMLALSYLAPCAQPQLLASVASMLVAILNHLPEWIESKEFSLEVKVNIIFGLATGALNGVGELAVFAKS